MNLGSPHERTDSYALVVFGDILTPTGSMPADVIFTRLTAGARWYLRRAPKMLSQGTRILFYQISVGVRGQARVVSVVPDSTNVIGGTLVSMSFASRVDLDEIISYSKPIPLAASVPELNFIKNKVYWGHSLRTSPRKISRSDYNLIVSQAK